MFQTVLFPMDTGKKIPGMMGVPLDSSSDPPSRKGTSPCLVTVLNLASIVGYVPFKIELSSATGFYHVKPVHLIRKVLCALIHLTIIWTYIGFNQQVTVLSKPKDLSSNFIQTFDFVTGIGTMVLMILFSITFWRAQDQVLKIIEETKVEFEKGQERKLTGIATLIFLVGYISSSYIYRNFYGDSDSVDYSLVFAGETSEVVLISVGKIIWDLFRFHALTMTYFSYVLIAMIGLTMRGVRIDFCDKMSETLVTMDMTVGFDNYMALKELTTDITQTFGNHILVYYIISVAYFAKIPESSVWQRHVETTGMIVYFAMGAIVWLISAEFHMNVRDVVQNWATQMQDLDDLSVDTRIRLLSVVNDNLLDPIGVSCKFFTITYGFLGSMLGLIVTYAIIVFQMQTKPSQSIPSTSQIPEMIIETLFPSTTTPAAN